MAHARETRDHAQVGNSLVTCMHEGLSTAIDTLYRIFAAYPCERLVQSDSDCARDPLVDEMSDSLCGKELRSLELDNLFDYYYLAVSHIGDSQDLRHFLPRILEIIVTEPASHLEPKLLPDLLRRADAHEMTVSERDALRSVIENADGMLPSSVIVEALRVLEGDRSV